MSINLEELTRATRAAIGMALTDTMQQFKKDADSAYADTRFKGTFTVQPVAITSEASLVNAAPLFHVVEYPTRAHDIAAKNVPNLVFYWKARGKWFVGPLVHHPGTKGKLKIDPLFDAASNFLGGRLEYYLDQLNNV